MEYFEKLNKAWQKGINDEIDDVNRGQPPEAAALFREKYAEYLSKVFKAQKPRKSDLADIQESYVDFMIGWSAAVDKLVKDSPGLVSSWVREHGEFTELCDDDGEHPAYVVKEADLV